MNEAQKPRIAIRCVLFKDTLTPSSVMEGDHKTDNHWVTSVTSVETSSDCVRLGGPVEPVPGSHLFFFDLQSHHPSRMADQKTDSHRVGHHMAGASWGVTFPPQCASQLVRK